VTRVVRHGAVVAPLAARAGLLVPGLGHLLAGQPLVGGGLLALDTVLAAAAVSGLPRTHEILGFCAPDGPYLHGAVALASLFGLTALAWGLAYRFAFPAEISEQDFHGHRQSFLRQFQRNRTGQLGLAGVTLIVAMALLAPLLAPHDPDAIDVGPLFAPPSWDFPLGTDGFGRDSLSRVLYGGRISLVIGFIAVGISATIGITVGAVAGYVGGWVDRALMWFVDLLLSTPPLVLILTIVALFRVNGPAKIFLVVAVLGFTTWMGVSRLVRSQILSLKEQEFVQAARALGLSHARIVTRHLIPNALAPVLVYASLAIGGIITAEAGLSFLGLGVPPPTSTWGTLVADGREALRQAWWLTTFPGLFIVAAVMSFNLLGDGLRDALDPKLRGR
jgi:peptide/nickel transport system permease protein